MEKTLGVYHDGAEFLTTSGPPERNLLRWIQHEGIECDMAQDSDILRSRSSCASVTHTYTDVKNTAAA